MSKYVIIGNLNPKKKFIIPAADIMWVNELNEEPVAADIGVIGTTIFEQPANTEIYEQLDLF